MRVSRIEIFGFKSFMERLVLPLEGGITSVVGPNGCGKSNIVDAIRWVLGETRAKNLRGGVLEDVIFNGTDALRPLGLAEVTLTLRAAEDNFFQDLVSPTAEAEQVVEQVLAEAEEALEQSSAVEAQAEAPEEVISEENAAREQQTSGEESSHLRVIEGNLDKVVDEASPERNGSGSRETVDFEKDVSSPPDENQSAVSEVALLKRFSWLQSVSEVQVTRRLYRSGESEFFINRVPCRLKDLKEFFRAVGISARAYTIVAQGEVSRIVTSKPEDRRLILEEAAGVIGFRDKIATAKRRLGETDVNISRLEDIIKEVTRQVNSLRRQAARAKNRETLKERIKELDITLFQDRLASCSGSEKQVTDDVTRAEEVERSAQAALQRLQAAEEAARNALISVDVEGDALRSKIDTIKEELSNRSRARAEKKSRASELRAFALARETELRRLDERLSLLSSRRDEASAAASDLRRRASELEGEIRRLEQYGDQELEAASRTLEEKRNVLRETEHRRQKIREELVAVTSTLEALQERLKAVSPVEELRKTLAERESELQSLGLEISLFAEGLTVPERYVQAVQAVLAERAEFLVANSPIEVARELLRTAAGEGKAESAVGIFAAGDADLPAAGQTFHGFPALLEQIEVDGSSRLAAKELLQHVYVVETLEEALSFFEQHQDVPAHIQLVTLDGDVLHSISFYRQRNEGGIIQLKSKADILQEKQRELHRSAEEGEERCREAQDTLTRAEEDHREALRKSQERQGEVRRLSNERSAVFARAESEERAVEQVEQDTQKAKELIVDARRKIDEFRTEEERVQEEIAALVPDEESRMKEELAKFNDDYRELDQRRQEERKRLAVAASEVEESRRKLDRAREKLSELHLRQQKVSLESEHVRERVLEEYGEETYQGILQAISSGFERLPEEEIASSREEVTKLRARIAREGDVDPSSIAEFEKESERLEELKHQQKDLQQAAGTLKKTIERLTATSEERFVATFEAVRQNFSGLVPRLFGGGKGSLELSDPANPLDSGVEIIARPPGKKLKSIDLLSGGEKALCATALILGMFMERPSPLCVLDEVDAPLDDANLVRFLSLIREMSSKTQFLLITHNKQSMAVADNLVGVTMEQPGASRVLTVSLQEAYSQVA